MTPLIVSISDVCEAIATTLSAATDIKSVRSIADIGERIANTDCPCLQVCPEGYIPNVGAETDRATFGGVIRKSKLTVHVYHYPRKMSHIGLDLKAMVEGLDAVSAVLESQEQLPFFGLVGIKAFSWSWKRMTLLYADGKYRGGCFTLNLYIY